MRVAFTLTLVILAALLGCREMAFGESFEFIIIICVNTSLSVTVQLFMYLNRGTGFGCPPLVVLLHFTEANDIL